MPSALGEARGEMTMYATVKDPGLSSLYKQDAAHLGIQLDAAEKVTVDTLDQFCEQANITYIHLLKLDVEGYEYKVLQGARHMLAEGRISYIQFEFGRTNIAARTYLRDFFDLLGTRYRFYRIVKDGLYPITYNEKREIFWTTNFVAELITP